MAHDLEVLDSLIDSRYLPYCRETCQLQKKFVLTAIGMVMYVFFYQCIFDILIKPHVTIQFISSWYICKRYASFYRVMEMDSNLNYIGQASGICKSWLGGSSTSFTLIWLGIKQASFSGLLVVSTTITSTFYFTRLCISCWDTWLSSMFDHHPRTLCVTLEKLLANQLPIPITSTWYFKCCIASFTSFAYVDLVSCYCNCNI